VGTDRTLVTPQENTTLRWNKQQILNGIFFITTSPLVNASTMPQLLLRSPHQFQPQSYKEYNPMKLDRRVTQIQPIAQNLSQPTTSVTVLTEQELQAIAGGKVRKLWAAVGVN
jgi:hypothetical protein